MRLRVHSSIFVQLILATALIPAALAQPSETAHAAAAAPEPAPTISPPVLDEFVEARWPEGEPREREEPVGVLLEVTIGADGKVSGVEVAESAGEAFDMAAMEAVRAFVFQPARRGGEPIPVKITYRYDFTVAHPGADETAPRNQPGDGAGGPADPGGAIDDGLGAAGSAAPEPSLVPGDAAPPAPGDAAELPPPELSFGATVEIEAPPREVTKRSIEKEKLMKIPGTGGDALRAIEVMPGVGRTSIDNDSPLVRGAAWNETETFVEGVSAPTLYHFGGVKSAFNSHLLERVDLYPGNFSARYGRATGAIIEAGVRDPRRDGLHGVLELSLLDSMALVETPVGDSAAVALAGRRSNVDFFFEQVVPDDAYNVVAAPLYWDYQAIGVVDLDRDNKLRLLGYGSSDTLKLLFSDPSEFDPALRGTVDFSIRYHRAQAGLESNLGQGVSQKVQVTYGRTRMKQFLGPLQAHLAQHEIYSRAEWGAVASEGLRINWGFDVEADFMKGYYVGPQAPQAEGSGNDAGLSGESLTVVDTGDEYSLGSTRPAGYIEAEWRIADRLLLIPGVRADYYGNSKEWTVDPRLSARLELTDQTTLKWGAGLYSQNPEYYELMEDFGNPDLEPYHALHLGLGVEHRPTKELELGLEGFYKHLYDRVVATPGGAPPTFVNDGTGRIYGGELFTRYAGDKTTVWAAYTLSRSERKDRDEAWRLFEQDQTHVLSLTATRKLGRGWELGGRFRLTSGDPYTPVVGTVYDTTIDVYRPIDGPLYSERSPVFHQLDVRLEKEWTFPAWTFAAYLDVQNAYNAENVMGESYSYDYSEKEQVSGLPLFPNIGIRGEL